MKQFISFKPAGQASTVQSKRPSSTNMELDDMKPPSDVKTKSAAKNVPAVGGAPGASVGVAAAAADDDDDFSNILSDADMYKSRVR
jgi:hypothetical protein